MEKNRYKINRNGELKDKTTKNSLLNLNNANEWNKLIQLLNDYQKLVNTQNQYISLSDEYIEELEEELQYYENINPNFE